MRIERSYAALFIFFALCIVPGASLFLLFVAASASFTAYCLVWFVGFVRREQEQDFVATLRHR